jgi:hypothetical protein
MSVQTRAATTTTFPCSAPVRRNLWKDSASVRDLRGTATANVAEGDLFYNEHHFNKNLGCAI